MPASTPITRVAVFGGSGFLGHRIVEQLAAAGIEACAAVRSPDEAPKGPRMTATYADVRDGTFVEIALEGCDAAVNAVGLYVEKGSATFEAVHVHGAEHVARACAGRGLKRLVHISGIGSDANSSSAYVRSRGRGEDCVRAAFPDATILRPSVMFAPDDHFVNAVAGIARTTPALPMFGSGETRLQPVFSGDVAAAVAAALQREEAADKVYELGGPDVFTFRALLEKVLAAAGRERLLMPLPFALWDALAALSTMLSSPPITEGQVALMRSDNVVSGAMPGLADLGVAPTPLDAVLPDYRF